VGFQEQELKKEMGENREKNTDWIAVSTSPRYYRHTLRPDQPLDHANADANMSKRHRQRYRRFFFGNSLPPKWLGDFFFGNEFEELSSEPNLYRKVWNWKTERYMNY
jgi:hypothetical protein